MAWGGVGALLFCPALTIAQNFHTSFDIGAVALRYADSVNTTAATFSPDFKMESERAVAQVTGTFSQFRGSGWSAQGVASGSLFSPTRSGLVGELAGVAGGSTHQDGTRTGQVIANVRLHALRARGGVFSGVGGGTTWDGAAWRRLLMGEVGGWVQNGPATTLVTITPVAVNDSIRYVDGQLTLSQSLNRLDLSFLAGARAGSQIPGVETQTRAWGSLTAVAWLRPRVALVASGGTYPVDPTQGFPGGRYLSVSVRFANAHSRAGKSDAEPAVISEPNVEPRTPEPSGGLESFQVDRKTPGEVVFRVSAPGAQTVEVNGDFSGWTPVKLQAAGEGVWTASFSLAPGQYQMNLRVDGGNWLVPPGLLALKDEFGGSVGLLVIE